MDELEARVAEIAAKRTGAKPPKKHAGGRPTKYDARVHCEAVEATSRQGATTLSIAAACGVSIQTIYTWCDEHPEFLEAVTRAKKNADDLVVNALFRRALGSSLVPPDTKACTVWLGNRRPDEWRETSRMEHTGANGGPIVYDIADKTDAELIAEAEAITREAAKARSDTRRAAKKA